MKAPLRALVILGSPFEVYSLGTQRKVLTVKERIGDFSSTILHTLSNSGVTLELVHFTLLNKLC
jgi:hypothetical protein